MTDLAIVAAVAIASAALVASAALFSAAFAYGVWAWRAVARDDWDIQAAGLDLAREAYAAGESMPGAER